VDRNTVCELNIVTGMTECDSRVWWCHAI